MTAQQGAPAKNVLTIRTGVIRDGTRGISISLGGRLVGEWTDSRANSLALGDDLRVKVLGADGGLLYTFVVPGRVLSGEAVSRNHVDVTFEP